MPPVSGASFGRRKPGCFPLGVAFSLGAHRAKPSAPVFFGNRSATHAAKEMLSPSFSKTRVVSAVIAGDHQNEILGGIVKSIFIFVMDVFDHLKMTPHNFLHYVPMLIFPGIWLADLYFPICKFVCASMEAPASNRKEFSASSGILKFLYSFCGFFLPARFAPSGVSKGLSIQATNAAYGSAAEGAWLRPNGFHAESLCRVKEKIKCQM